MIRKQASAFLLALALFGAAAQCAAAELEEYRTNLRAIRSQVNELMFIISDEDDAEYMAEMEDEVLADIRQRLKGSEKITWEGGTAETSDHWLSGRLDQFENEADPAKRAAILTEINEKLSAITLKLDELENVDSSGRTKDQDKQKLAEILSRPEYQPPKAAEETAFQKWLTDFLDWIAGAFPRPNISPSKGAWSVPSLLTIVLYIALFAAVGLILYKLLPLIVPSLRRRSKGERKDRIILGERIADEESARDLFSMAEQLAREGNIRAAIRKGYIALLCELSDRKLIGLARHKTNRDYLRDVRPQRSLHSDLSRLTDLFERNWYGSADSDESDWEAFREKYKEAVSRV